LGPDPCPDLRPHDEAPGPGGGRVVVLVVAAADEGCGGEAVGDDPLGGRGGAADVEVQLDGVEGRRVGGGGEAGARVGGDGLVVLEAEAAELAVDGVDGGGGGRPRAAC